MLNYIWAGMIVLSLIFSFFTDKTQQLSVSVLSGANSAIELLLSILGIMCFWSGMMEIGKRSGLTSAIGRILRPVLRHLFPDIDEKSEAMNYISLNISANLLGLGNAATPFGLAAMRELRKEIPESDNASDSMLLFVVMNTASIQLLPTTIGAYRASYGSCRPFDILLCVWITSIVALVAGVGVAKFFSKGTYSHNRLRGEKNWR